MNGDRRTARVLVTDYAWPSLAVETELLGAIGAELIVADQGSEAELIELAAGGISDDPPTL